MARQFFVTQQIKAGIKEPFKICKREQRRKKNIYFYHFITDITKLLPIHTNKSCSIHRITIYITDITKLIPINWVSHHASN